MTNEPPGFGDVLCNSVSDARFLVIAPGAAASMPSLNGVALCRGNPQPCSKKLVPAAVDCDLQGGRRYVDKTTGLTLLCIWPGGGSLRHEGRPMVPDDGTGRKLTPAAARALESPERVNTTSPGHQGPTDRRSLRPLSRRSGA
jgi:hypothetical protein